MKMQNVSFQSVDDFLDYLPDDERKIVDVLRKLILHVMPDAQEKLSYNVPYYWLHSRVCFIWPSAIPWGKVPLKGVILGFCRGHLLLDDINFLEKGNRKEVYTKTFYSVSEINEELILTYLYQAIEIDQKCWIEKKQAKK